MVKALNDGNLSQSHAGTVSISCYFQKKDSASASTQKLKGGSSGKTSARMTTEENSEESTNTEVHQTNVQQREKNVIKKM